MRWCSIARPRPARLTVLENAGHLPHLEQPEATFAVIDEFLAALPTRSS
ncbi:hypothetical protein KPL76_03495 [Subtercola sp. PAMC28395]|nr:hypothetical protein [Subtercola sp. PAMC28395]QWT24474.1 hypothetical protein KPL76_03495 [Subtercola sp. PAMC28395]